METKYLLIITWLGFAFGLFRYLYVQRRKKEKKIFDEIVSAEALAKSIAENKYPIKRQDPEGISEHMMENQRQKNRYFDEIKYRHGISSDRFYKIMEKGVKLKW